jgi:hypothetical protein
MPLLQENLAWIAWLPFRMMSPVIRVFEPAVSDPPGSWVSFSPSQMPQGPAVRCGSPLIPFPLARPSLVHLSPL